MAAITLKTDNMRLLQEEALSRRLLRWALVASLMAHLAALAIFSTVRLRPQAIPQPQKLIEVKLLEPPPAIAAQPVPRPAVESPPASPRLAVRATARTPSPKPPIRHVEPSAPRPTPVRPIPRSAAAVIPAVPRPAVTRVQPRPTVPAPAPVVTPPVPRPAAGSGGPAGASGGGDDRPPKPGGGEVGLGSGSRQGSLPGGGGGGSSGPPAVGSGSGSGSGPGTGRSGGSGPGTGGGVGGRSGPGSGSAGTGSGAGTGSAAGTAPAGPAHVSRLADRRIPTLVHRVNPVYPMVAQVEGVQGAVKLLVTVTKEGKVGAVKVARSSGDARLDASAVNAVKQWRYEPAVQDGIAREVNTYATVTFSLQ